jgi:hypothetical protein
MKTGRLKVENPIEVNDKMFWITLPTINTLIDGLNQLKENGVDPDEYLNISHLANALGTFAIRPLN